ncbi:MAG: pteridine reductase [Pseudomonadales bacterium]
MSTDSSAKVILITGAAKRVGAAIARLFHQNGYSVAIHFLQSGDDAEILADEFNQQRNGSAAVFSGDLAQAQAMQSLAEDVVLHFGRLDVLVNNASRFFPTPVGAVSEEEWDSLLGSNLKGPFFLSQACTPALTASSGAIINMVDIYAQTPLKDHPLYCSAKAGLAMLTKNLARDLAPNIRVNGIAPGAILWPNGDSPELNEDQKSKILGNIPMQRLGSPEDIAQTALFLADRAPYITGHIITVDGGRSVSL